MTESRRTTTQPRNSQSTFSLNLLLVRILCLCVYKWPLISSADCIISAWFHLSSCTFSSGLIFSFRHSIRLDVKRTFLFYFINGVFSSIIKYSIFGIRWIAYTIHRSLFLLWHGTRSITLNYDWYVFLFYWILFDSCWTFVNKNERTNEKKIAFSWTLFWLSDDQLPFFLSLSLCRSK